MSELDVLRATCDMLRVQLVASEERRAVVERRYQQLFAMYMQRETELLDRERVAAQQEAFAAAAAKAVLKKADELALQPGEVTLEPTRMPAWVFTDRLFDDVPIDELLG